MVTLVFLVVPQLHRIAALAPALGFVAVATATLGTLCIQLGTDTGLLFYFFAMAAGIPMVLGIGKLGLTIGLVALCPLSVTVLNFTVPGDTGVAPGWLLSGGFVVNAVVAGGLGAAVMGYGLYQIQQAELTLDQAHRRSQALLDNILPRSVSERLQDPAHPEIADGYDDASILFADIAGFTAMSSRLSPQEVVAFLDRLYSALDALVERHGLEKIKTTGDAYLVVSGVPEPRHDHLTALARFALDMRRECGQVRTAQGAQVPMRIGLACGPVVAGVVGSTKFFYDVWGDAVNLASRMESTGVPGKIQVPQDVRDRLADRFVFTERGVVEVKGKQPQHTWFLESERADPAAR